MHPRLPSVLVATVVLLTVATALPAAAQTVVGEPRDGLPPGLGIRLLDVPVDQASDPRANQYIVDHVIPGAAVERRVEVSNGTDEPLPVEMVGADARIDDGWVVEAPDDDPGKVSAWIAATPSSFVLAPNSVTEVAVLVSVPGGVPPGERYGVVVAQPPAVQGGAANLVSRVGVRLYLSIGGDEPETDFTIDTLSASRTETGEPSIDVGILNTGGRASDVAGELVLNDGSGAVSAGPFPTALPRTLAPQSRDQVTVPLPSSLAAGPWEVTATMRSGLVERVATATVTFPDEAGAVAEPAESEIIGGTDEDGNDISERLRQQRRTLLPIATFLILLALVGLFLLLWWQRRDGEDEEETTVPAGVGHDDAG